MKGLRMKMYCWSTSDFLCVVHAETVEEARALALREMGGKPDGSSQQMTNAWIEVNRQNPVIWAGRDAEFTLTDSAQLEEADSENARLQRALSEICGIASQRDVDAPGYRSMIEIIRLCQDALPRRRM